MRRTHSRALFLCPLLAACGGGGGDGGPRPRFELPAEAGAPIPVVDAPFPNDTFVDEEGELQITAETLPFAEQADQIAVGNAAKAFQRLDCFGAGGGVIFPIDGVEDDAIDPDTLTQETAFLVDLESGEALPTEPHYRPTEHQISLRAVRGHQPEPGRTYAAVLTRGVKTESGKGLRPVRDLKRVLTAERRDQVDDYLGRAFDAYAPLRDWLGGGEADISDIAGATVYTTCAFGADLDEVVSQLDAMDPPAATVDRIYAAGAELDGFLGTPDDNQAPGIDNPGGIAHSDIAYVVLGTFPSPNYQSAVPGKLGFWERDGDGALMVKGYDDVPFLLVLPAGVGSYADLPVVIYQHGINDSRRAIMAVANSLAAQGFAVVGIDIPYHGDRFPGAADSKHNFTDEMTPDGLADPTGPTAALVFFDLMGDDQVERLDPRVMTDSFLQAAVDMMTLSRFVDGGDLSALADAEPALSGLSFRADRMVFSSESFGGFIGTLALAFEPRYEAAFMSVAGGGLVTDLLPNSPKYGQLFMPILQGAFNVSPSEVDPHYDPPRTHYLYQMLAMILARADPLSYAGRVRDRGVHVVFPAAYSDESVPNQAAEALAVGLGLEWAPAPNAVDGPSWLDPALLPEVDLPVSGNVDGDQGARTAAFFEIDPASHGMLTRQNGKREYEPGFAPFVPRDQPSEFKNPIGEIQGYLVEFAQSYVETGTPTLGASQ